MQAKQFAFIKHYATTGNGTEAARLAGYKVPTVEAVRLLKNPTIVAEISKLQAKSAAKLQLTRDRSLEIASGIAEDVSQKAKDRISALSFIGKLQGWEAARKFEHSGPNGGPIALQVAALSDDELDAELKKVAK